MSATNVMENGLLSLIFENANYANVGDVTGLRGSTTAGVFYISLATADPTETGSQTSNESAYTNYARVSVARSTAGWTVASGVADNDAAVTYAACGVTGSTVTHFGIGSDASGAGNLFFKGALAASRAISSGITPEFAAGTIDVSLD